MDVDRAGRHLATGSHDRTIRIWDLKTKALIRTIENLEDSVYVLSFHPEGVLLAAGGKDRRVVVWNVESGTRLCGSERLDKYVWDLAWHPDGERLASACGDGVLRLHALKR